MTATRLFRASLLIALLAFQGWAIRLRHRSIPVLSFGSPPATQQGMRPPQLQSWGAYRSEESYRITGDAKVRVAFALDAEGRLRDRTLQIAEVQLGAAAGSSSPAARDAEAREYVKTVLSTSRWQPAQVDGHASPYATDQMWVSIEQQDAEAGGSTIPQPPSSQRR